MIKRLFYALVGTAFVWLAVPAPSNAIGFIDSPTVYCRKVKNNDCLINVGYMSVQAAPNYITDLWLFLGSDLIFHAGGFFQQSMYVDNSFLGDGIPVKCGTADTTSPPPGITFPISYGASYSVTIRARDSAGLTSANFATAICPPR